jgi:hypothetical protein
MTDNFRSLDRREFVRGSLLLAGAAAFPGCSRPVQRKHPQSAASLSELIRQKVKAGAKQELSVFLGGEDYIEGLANYVAFGFARQQGAPVIGAATKVWIAPGAGGEGAPLGPLTAAWAPYAKPDAPAPAPQGLNAAELTFDRAGVWQVLVEAESGGARLLGTSAIQIKPKAQASTLLPGARSLASKTPTMADAHGVHPICTRSPACTFHRITLAKAITLGKPTAFIIATPKYCMSRTCGPNLEELISVAQSIGDRASFVHAEVYRSDKAEDIRTQAVSPTMAEWKLQSEPWLFIIDRDGKIAKRFEGPIVAPTINSAFQPLLG